MARYKLSQRMPELLSAIAHANYPFYPIDALFKPRVLSDENFSEELEGRLKTIPYPYKPTRAQKAQSQSTFELIRKRGVLSSIFEPSLISRLKASAVDKPEYWSILRQIRSTSTVLGSEFRHFHNSFAKELARHTAALRKLKDEYQLGNELIGLYLQTAEEQLINEAALLRMYTEESEPDSDSKATRDSVRMVYSLISDALQRGNVSNHALSCHLTSIICSPNCLTTAVLSPSPESVRKLLERNPVKKPTKSTN